MASVRVAVRVRPLNHREKQLLSKAVVRVNGSTTTIYQPSNIRCFKPKDRMKAFSFDHSYDSSDKESPAFASQEKIFNDLGSDVLKAAFEGFNACVFAYGQTGSGKSFTMMGHAEDKGLIPRIGEGLFKEMSERSKSDAVSFRTEVSYLEIYNERVQDLLKKNSDGGNLRVREHPSDGPYVENLSKHLIQGYSDMEDLITLGDANRTTASTGMNDVSSRSHAIFTVRFVQAWFDTDSPREILSKIHLVDLAGSERANATLSRGTRLKEGANINKSLGTLGSVISALADLTSGEQPKKNKQVFIPYRDSVLTWLLKDSLGGNSKTTMIATVSPAGVNYSETLSTLRYASRAKNIVNSPTVNEDGSVKIIRELRAEVTRLHRLLEDATQISCAELSSPVKVKEELHQNEAKVLALTKEWTSKWSETQNILQGEEALALRKEGSGVVLDCQLPHLIGIEKDPLSSGIVLYFLKEGRTRIGSEKGQDIVLHGPELLAEHCVLENCGGAVTLVPRDGAACSLSGSEVTDPCQLMQGNIIQLGSGTFLRFNHPHEAAQLREESQIAPPAALTLSLTDLSKSTENLSKVMLQDPGNLEKKGELIQPKKLHQQVQESPRLTEENGELLRPKTDEETKRASMEETGLDLESLATEPTEPCSSSTPEKLYITTAMAGKSPVPLTNFELDGDKIQGGVSTRDGHNQERDSCHKSRPGLMSARPWREAQSGAGVSSYQRGVEVWSGDASLQQTSVLGPGDGCGVKPEGNANEIQGVVCDCYKGRPGSGGSSLGSMSHLQSGRGTGSVSVLPQTNTQSQMDKTPLSSQTPRRPPEQTVLEGQSSCEEMDERGHLQELPRVSVSESAAAATGQSSGLGPLVRRVSWMALDAGRLLLSPRTTLQRIRNEGLRPLRAHPVVSLVRESNVAALVKNSQVFSAVKGSFVFSLLTDNYIFSTVKELPLVQHIHMEITYLLQPEEATEMIQGCINPHNTQPLPLKPTPTIGKAEELSGNESGIPENVWTRNTNIINLPKNKDMAVIHVNQEDKPVTESEVTSVSEDAVQSVFNTGDDRFFRQALIEFPDSLSHLQTLSLQEILSVLSSVISATVITSQKIVALFWLSVAKCSQPDPRPALLILAETGLYTLTADSGPLVLFHHLPLSQLKEVHIGLAGQNLRFMGGTEESILGVYTHSEKLTQELCRIILGAICPGDSRVFHHPLLNGDLMRMSMDCHVYVPDLLMDAGLRVCSQFQKNLAELIYLLHCNMDHSGISLGEVHILLYLSVAVTVGHSLHTQYLAQLFLTDTHLGLLQEDAIFHLAPGCVAGHPRRPLFHNLTLRRRADVRCVLLHDEDEHGTVRLDVILANARAKGRHESVTKAPNPHAQASNSSPRAEVWKLTFSNSADTARLVNHLSNG